MILHRLMSTVLQRARWRVCSHVQKRWLTQNETSTALRPFYFAVHPDLFTQHPKERVVNEESLKILNSYVESLLNQRCDAPSKRLPFYIRDKSVTQPRASSTEIRLIRISLEASDIRSAVSHILKACDLSTEYLDGLKPSPRPTQTAGSIPNPEVYKPKPPLYISTWLRKHVDRARQLEAVNGPILEETERLRGLLCEELGLSDVNWTSNWGLSNYHACLKRFAALCQELRGEPWVAGLKGHKLAFGSETGVNALGEVVLSSDDVPQDWVNVLRSVRRYDDLLAQLPALEAEVSYLLNGIQVVRRRYEATVMADKYVANLKKIICMLQLDIAGALTGDLRHLRLVVEGASGPLTVSPRGQILVPCSCPGLIVRNFIEQKKLTAARSLLEYDRNRTEEELVTSECAHALGLRSLVKEDHVTCGQMRECCLRLISDVRQLGVAVSGLRMRVSQYYSVMNSGEIVVPWDWKGYPA